ncbi:hypothetical protein H5410_013912 [Solanum commersonii]|uniref:Uncharacterized protein n=1 Tax=Solanum commersonii TaxID=4109 RepID=A0A9J5ZPJ4_SOLCO|nr:hypothetical protein H5410_013912 [Solanum commersonii]
MSNGNTLYGIPPTSMSKNAFIHHEDMKKRLGKQITYIGPLARLQADQSLRDKLRTIWPNLKVGRSDEWLWMHEWRNMVVLLRVYST